TKIMPLTKFPDYYAVLNLPFGSSPDVIKKYYRELAKFIILIIKPPDKLQNFNTYFPPTRY
ncbi:MAG: J domain-containing protein, partial [Leptospiraceae bacterium]|nr:J domain-containing protein [Leptospiraceae bacterium]